MLCEVGMSTTRIHVQQLNTLWGGLLGELSGAANDFLIQLYTCSRATTCLLVTANMPRDSKEEMLIVAMLPGR